MVSWTCLWHAGGGRGRVGTAVVSMGPCLWYSHGAIGQNHEGADIGLLDDPGVCASADIVAVFLKFRVIS
jgi:hypothetical protein